MLSECCVLGNFSMPCGVNVPILLHVASNDVNVLSFAVGNVKC